MGKGGGERMERKLLILSAYLYLVSLRFTLEFTILINKIVRSEFYMYNAMFLNWYLLGLKSHRHKS